MPKQKHRSTEPSVRVLRVSVVCDLTSLTRASIYNWVAAGRFPAPVRLSVRRVAWREADIVGWLQSRPVAPWATRTAATPSAGAAS